ncbi:calcium-binding protein [Cribrihabitans sp. XS_ASV171]
MATRTGSFNSNGGQIHWFGTVNDDVFNIQLNNINPDNDRPRHDSHHVYGYGGGDLYSFTQFDILQDRTTGRLDTFDPTRDVIRIDGVTLDLGIMNAAPDHSVDIGGVTASVVEHRDQQWLRMQVGSEKAALFALEGVRTLDGVDEQHFESDLSLDAILAKPAVEYLNPFNFVPYAVYADWDLRDHSPSQSDVVSGTSSGDFIFGPKSGGSQVVHGLGGNDVLQGASGQDTIHGGPGNDAIAGGIDDDVLYGDDGADTLYGGSANDVLFGGQGEDQLFGNDGGDQLYGANGNDLLDGGAGNDSLNGQYEDDTLVGGDGADTLTGEHGNDNLGGGALGDLLSGGIGADFLNGGSGYDQLIGGAGADEFYHEGVFSHGADWIQDFTSADGDVLKFGGQAVHDDFQVNFANTPNAGMAGIDEAFVIYRPTGQILWSLVDGAAEPVILLALDQGVHDLLL